MLTNQATTLADIFDQSLFKTMIDEGYVRIQVHPTLPLKIANYSEKTAYEGVWNPVTLACRGLIFDEDSGEIVARPFRKFFNAFQAGAPELDLNRHVIVTDKADGSLGIIYPTPDGFAVATRGSFASEQAIHATALLAKRYPDFLPPENTTVLVEIVYPENRIVLDYDGLDDLILLGAVDIKTGKSVPPDWGFLDWPGPRTTIFEFASFAEALAAPPRPNAEGLVVHWLASDERVKLKQEDYVALHRIVTGLNARTVWQHIVDGKPIEDLIEPIPDEFHEWVRGIALLIEANVHAEERRLRASYDVALRRLSDDYTRKDLALSVANDPDKWAIFALADGKDIRARLLANAKPEPYVTPSGRIFTEETA